MENEVCKKKRKKNRKKKRGESKARADKFVLF